MSPTFKVQTINFDSVDKIRINWFKLHFEEKNYPLVKIKPFKKADLKLTKALSKFIVIVKKLIVSFKKIILDFRLVIMLKTVYISNKVDPDPNPKNKFPEPLWNVILQLQKLIKMLQIDSVLTH